MSWHTSRDPARAGLPVHHWSCQYRTTWNQALARKPSPLRVDGGGPRIAQATLLKSEKGLRRWLGFLHRLDRLDEAAEPWMLLTPELLEEYFLHLVECGNADNSIVGRFRELELAFRLMYPGRDFGWLVKPQGVPLEHVLRMSTKPRFVPSSAEVLEWAEELFQSGLTKLDAQIRCALIRDALMVAILAMPAPRLRALSSLRLGVHVVPSGGEWFLEQTPDITKMGKAIPPLPLGPEVGGMVDRNVRVERAEMLRGKSTSDAFWISWYGRPLAKTSISGLIWDRTLERFGTGFGPHRFRRSLTTTIAMESPSASRDASVILGHTPAVALAHYNKATAMAAGRRHHDRLRDMRSETAELAMRAFRVKF